MDVPRAAQHIFTCAYLGLL